MIGWIVQATTLSLCLIAVLHYLYVFFKTTLTVPKVKDLVNRPQKQYDAIFNTMGAGGTKHAAANIGGSGGGTARVSTTDISTLPILGVSGGSGGSGGGSGGQRNPWENREGASVSMKQELKHFLKELNSNNNNR